MSRHGAAGTPKTATRIRRRWLWTVLLGIGLLFVWYFKILALGYYWIETTLNAAQWQGSSLWLPG